MKLSDLVRTDLNPRRVLDQSVVKRLADSIKEIGLQEPVILTPRDGAWLIAIGNYRVEALKLLHGDDWEVPETHYLIRDLGDEKIARISLEENLNRQNLSDIELGQSMVLRRERFGYTQDDLAKIYDMSQAQVSECIRNWEESQTGKMPEAVKEDLSKVPDAEGRVVEPSFDEQQGKLPITTPKEEGESSEKEKKPSELFIGRPIKNSISKRGRIGEGRPKGAKKSKLPGKKPKKVFRITKTHWREIRKIQDQDEREKLAQDVKGYEWGVKETKRQVQKYHAKERKRHPKQTSIPELAEPEELKPEVYFHTSEDMHEISDGTAQLVVTSPGYWRKKDYSDHENQIFRLDRNYGDYRTRLKKVWEECWRILKPDGRLVINIGDYMMSTKEHGRYGVKPTHAHILMDCEEIGFTPQPLIMWYKNGAYSTCQGGSWKALGSYPYPPNILTTVRYEFILVLRKTPEQPVRRDRDIKELSKLENGEWREYSSDLWQFAPVRQNSHIAMFPEELPRRAIRLYSFVGDIVVDPFLGSGTTLKVARQLKRKGIGYEINEEYADLISNKVYSG